MRVLVCGGRDYGEIPRGCPPEQFARYRERARRESFLLEETLYCFDRDEHRITVLIHGAASGADSHAAYWARQLGIPREAFPADWYPNGRSGGLDRTAGPKRNSKMLEEGRPDIVFAFPGGDGTADMVAKARKAGIEVREIT